MQAPPNSSSIDNLHKSWENGILHQFLIVFGFACKSKLPGISPLFFYIKCFWIHGKSHPLIDWTRRLEKSEVGDFSAGVGYIGAIDHLPKVPHGFGLRWLVDIGAKHGEQKTGKLRETTNKNPRENVFFWGENS